MYRTRGWLACRHNLQAASRAWTASAICQVLLRTINVVPGSEFQKDEGLLDGAARAAGRLEEIDGKSAWPAASAGSRPSARCNLQVFTIQKSSFIVIRALLTAGPSVPSASASTLVWQSRSPFVSKGGRYWGKGSRGQLKPTGRGPSQGLRQARRRVGLSETLEVCAAWWRL